MPRQFNKSNSKSRNINLLQYIGKPFFNLIYFSISSSLNLFLFLSKKTKSKRTHQLFPSSKLPTLNIHKTLSLINSLLPPLSPKPLLDKLFLLRPKVKLNLHLKSKTTTLLKNKSCTSPFKQTAKIIFHPLLLITLGFSLFIYSFIFYQLPNPYDLKKIDQKLTTYILDRNGETLYKIYKDENRTLIDIDTLPQYVTNSFLAAEDKDFYHHFGINFISTIRAIYKTISGQRVEGGSTITQQLIKNTLLTPEKTIRRKLREIVLAFETEMIFTKKDILSMYLNQVGFGGPAYGIQEASQQYFATDAAKLNLAQAAYLAGLTQAPSKYSPFSAHPEMAKSRQLFVLEQMLKNKFITEEERQQALETKLSFSTPDIAIKAPHFVMYVRDLLIDQFGEDVVNHGGLKITTTLNLKTQEVAQNAVSKEVEKIEKLNIHNGAALVTNPTTGEILAMVGSKNFFDLDHDGQVNITTSLRQPGSSIKPINYALAFEKGYTPASIIEDKPIIFKTTGQEPWIPKNYDNKFHGKVTLRQALANSYNIPAVLLLANNGINNFANLAQNLGITTWTDPQRFGLSMTLGSLEVKMTDLATAYSTFANGGQTTPLKSIIKIENTSGQLVAFKDCSSSTADSSAIQTVNASNSCSSKQTISPTTAFLISDILADNNARASAFGTNSSLNIPGQKVSVKTGTSNDLKDNWTIGYNPNYLVATWVGNNDSSPMSQVASGITGASPIWNKIMTQIIKNDPQSTISATPTNIIKVAICPLTGTLACDGCPNKYEYFTSGTEPKDRCTPEQIQSILSPSPTPSVTPQPQIL